MAGKKSHSILIGDQDDEHMKDMIKRFNTYRLTGTFWDYGIEIESVVDSVYFARSHYSRMLQLADAYIFIISHKFTKSRNGWMAEKLREELKDKIQPVMHKYKSWPSPNVDF
jgi:hypothetical protein